MTSHNSHIASSSPSTLPSEDGGGSSAASNLTLVTTLNTLSSNHGNEVGYYDYELVDGTDSRYECPICLACLRDPVLTTCGHRFCSECIHKWVVDQDGKCPVDSVSLSPEMIFPDNFTRREIMACKAKCPFSSVKDSSARCDVVLPVSDMERHIETEHKGSNLLTVNGGSGPLECPFKDVGCTVNFREDQREKHLEKDVHRHLQLLRTAYSRLKVLSCLEYPGMDESAEDYTFRRQRSWDSVRMARKLHVRPSTSRMASASGSQMCLPVNEESPFQSSHPVGTHPHTSQYFGHYTPPSSSHHSPNQKEGTLCGGGSSPEKGKFNGQSSPGVGGLEPHLQDVFHRLVLLEQKDRENQIRIEKLQSELKQVLNVTSSSAQMINDFTARYCNGVYVWRIAHFRRLCEDMRRNSKRVLNSPGFYTSTFGYKLCLRFNLTTPELTTSSESVTTKPVDVPLEQDENTFISLNVHLLQGEFDDALDWPFHGEMKVMIIHPTHPEDSVTELMSSKPGLAAFAKPTLPRNIKGFGYQEFCPVHKIFANGFVKDDTLVFKIQAKSMAELGKEVPINVVTEENQRK